MTLLPAHRKGYFLGYVLKIMKLELPLPRLSLILHIKVPLMRLEYKGMPTVEAEVLDVIYRRINF